MLSSQYDMFEQGIVVRVNEPVPVGKVSDFVRNWNEELDEKTAAVPGRDHGFVMATSPFGKTDSWQSARSSVSEISHPSISSVSSSPDAEVPIKYELRGNTIASLRPNDLDPGVIPRTTPVEELAPPIVPAKDHQSGKESITASTNTKSSTTVDQGHHRAASDTILHTNQTSSKSRRSLGLARQKANIYGRLPLLLLLSPEPCSLPPSRHEFSQGKVAKVSMESIKPKSKKNSKVVAPKEGVTRTSTTVVKKSTSVFNRKTVTSQEKEFKTKIVCGLPCASKEKEEELNYTLEILSGIGIRRVEEEEVRPRRRSKVV